MGVQEGLWESSRVRSSGWRVGRPRGWTDDGRREGEGDRAGRRVAGWLVGGDAWLGGQVADG